MAIALSDLHGEFATVVDTAEVLAALKVAVIEPGKVPATSRRTS